MSPGARVISLVLVAAVAIVGASLYPPRVISPNQSALEAPVAHLLAQCDQAAEAGDWQTWLRAATEAVHTSREDLCAGHPLRMRAHVRLGNAFLAIRDYKEAARQFEQVCRGDGNDRSPERLEAEVGLGLAKLQLGDLKSSRQLLDRVLGKTTTSQVGEPQYSIAIRALGNLSTWYLAFDRNDSARTVVEDALRMAERLPRPDTLLLSGLNEPLAIIRFNLAENSAAESLVTASFEAMSRKFGQTHLFLAPWYAMRGIARHEQRDFEKARALYDSASALVSEALGADHAAIAEITKHQSNLYFTTGEYAKADSVLQLGLALTRRHYGELHPLMGALYTNLGGMAWVIGDQERAVRSLEEAVRVYRVGGLQASMSYSFAVNNLAVVYRRAGRTQEALRLFEESLRIREALLGDKHPDVAHAMSNLANLYLNNGQPERVEPLMQRAIAIWESTVGPEDLRIASAAYNLATAHFSQGRYEEAKDWQERAYQIWSRALGMRHPFLGKSLANLARVETCRGRLDAGADYYERLLELRQDFVKYAFSFTSDDNKLRVLKEHPVIDHSLLALAASTQEPRLVALALDMVLRGKAIALEAMRADRSSSYCHVAAEGTNPMAEYRGVCDSLSALALSNSGRKEDLPAIEQLLNRQDSLESVMARSCGEFRRDLQWRTVTGEAIAAALPESTALWEYIRFDGYAFAGVGLERERQLGPRYGAFVVRNAQEPVLVDLGPAGEIDSLVDRSRSHLEGSSGLVMTTLAPELERQWRELGARLADKIVSPLLAKTPEGEAIVIAPDHLLSLLPFEIIPVQDSAYLIEERLLSYVSSGRDLLHLSNGHSVDGRAVIVADPAYDLEAYPAYASSNEGTDANRGSGEFRGGALTGDWLPLSQTRVEAECVAALLAAHHRFSLETLTGDRASEERVKNLGEPPAILHLATHGFHLPEDPQDSVLLANPLLRSGLVLAGAGNLVSPSDTAVGQSDDGYLTALEVSGLNLSTTQLVCLSACQSGAGDVLSAEGVAGLRRAFRMAGAQTLVMSLWDISDDVAREVVSGFYRGWLGGQSERMAMREAQLQLLHQSRQQYHCGHPRLWAGFILEGATD